MANTVRIKRRASGGAAGAPASLQNAELAFNESDDTLYYGKGTGGAGGSATTIEAIGGKGAVVMLNSAQTITGVKTFSASPVVPTPTTDTQAAPKLYVDQKLTSSPALGGTPTAPTASAGTNTQQIANTAFVQAAIAALIGGAPGALDALNELAAALGNDPNFASTVTSSLAAKLTAASNLSDLANPATARTNLGLGTMATQAANNVAITGGTIDGVTIDCGTV